MCPHGARFGIWALWYQAANNGHARTACGHVGPEYGIWGLWYRGANNGRARTPCAHTLPSWGLTGPRAITLLSEDMVFGDYGIKPGIVDHHACACMRCMCIHAVHPTCPHGPLARMARFSHHDTIMPKYHIALKGRMV